MKFNLKNTLSVALVGLIIGSTLISCTKNNSENSSQNTNASQLNKELKIGITQEFENLNPLIMSMSATNYIYHMVGRGLDTLDLDGKWVPQLVKSIPSLENGGARIITEGGKKKIESTWEILDNAKWGDGTDLTCADFKFSREVAAAPTVSVAEKESFTQVESIEWDASNPKKCIFKFEKARWDFYQLGGFYPLPKHLEESVFKKHAKQKEGYEKNSNYTKNPTNPGLYNGPYLISEVKLGSHVTLVPNPHFYGNKPKIEKVIVKLIPNTGTLEANLRSGTIDMVSSLGFAFDQALAFEKKVKSENLPYEVLFKPSITYEHIDLDLSNPHLKDLRVRKALVHAIDRDELTQALFEGRQTSAIHFIAPIDPWYTNDANKVVLYPYSKRQADKLLEEAGYKMNPDGYRYKDGKKLSLVFMTTAGNKTRETVQAYLQDKWKQVGAEIIIKNEPARVFFGDTTRKRNFGAMAMYAWVSAPESNPKSTYTSKNIPSAANGWSGQNYVGWVNKRVDQILEDLDVEFDPNKRKQLITEVLKLYTDEVPVIPMYYRSDVGVIPKNLKNFKLTGHSYPETNFIEDWTSN